jgi:DNA mismatch endonuclease (patch repair protein)
MARVRGRDTKPELVVRRFLHAAGLRYRLHQRIAGARPDLVFRSRRIVVMVHGCMWHQHPDPACKLARMPKSRLEFWRPKLEGNRERDQRQRAVLEAAGWKVLTVWECQVGEPAKLAALADEIRASHGKPRTKQG